MRAKLRSYNCWNEWSIGHDTTCNVVPLYHCSFLFYIYHVTFISQALFIGNRKMNATNS